jgi:hypothetical protein
MVLVLLLAADLAGLLVAVPVVHAVLVFVVVLIVRGRRRRGLFALLDGGDAVLKLKLVFARVVVDDLVAVALRLGLGIVSGRSRRIRPLATLGCPERLLSGRLVLLAGNVGLLLSPPGRLLGRLGRMRRLELRLLRGRLEDCKWSIRTGSVAAPTVEAMEVREDALRSCQTVSPSPRAPPTTPSTTLPSFISIRGPISTSRTALVSPFFDRP